MSSNRTQSQLCAATVSDLISTVAFVSSHDVYFNQIFLEVITRMQQNELIYMVFNTEGVIEVAIESCPE